MGRKSREKRTRRLRHESFRRNYLDPQPVKYPIQSRPAGGVTGAERALALLGRNTFLSLWSYPNVVRDERQPNGGVIAKEVADLIVVFENHVIIFSDKDCSFPATGNIDIDWPRWYRNAVAKSAAQLFGAERWIKQHPSRLFIDGRCRVPFPLAIPPRERMTVHRIVVAHGVGERCRSELGGNGTLIISPLIVGDDHCRPRAEGGRPFTVGQVDPSKGFVHIFDDASLTLVMNELDTVSDFVAYLTKREALMTSGKLGVAMGEEALLGWYVSKMNDEQQEHDFVVRDGVTSPVIVDESWWLKYQGSAARRRKQEADSVSYMWDELVELFTMHFMGGTADHLTDTSPASYERVLRFFARECRVRRRVLAKAINDMLATTPAHMRRLRVVPPMLPGDPYWVLLLVPFAQEISYRTYREGRREFLAACCKVVKLTWPEALDIVGFCTESGRGSAGSEDAIYLDGRFWTPEHDDEARRLRRDFQILTTPRMLRVTESEFPPDPNDLEVAS
jgi:hypothetical protein